MSPDAGLDAPDSDIAYIVFFLGVSGSVHVFEAAAGNGSLMSTGRLNPSTVHFGQRLNTTAPVPFRGNERFVQCGFSSSCSSLDCSRLRDHRIGFVLWRPHASCSSTISVAPLQGSLWMRLFDLHFCLLISATSSRIRQMYGQLPTWRYNFFFSFTIFLSFHNFH